MIFRPFGIIFVFKYVVHTIQYIITKVEFCFGPSVPAAGKLHSYERRQQFADVARRNVRNFIDGEHPAWELTMGDLVDVIADEPID